MGRPRSIDETPEQAKAREEARERKRRQRERERAAQVVTDSSYARDDSPADPSSSQIAPAGIVVSYPQLKNGEIRPCDIGTTTTASATYSEPVDDLMTEQARWVKVRREISELEKARRKGELVEREEAERQSATLCRRIRAALDRAPSHLPADLLPTERERCSKALATAIDQALAAL